MLQRRAQGWFPGLVPGVTACEGGDSPLSASARFRGEGHGLLAMPGGVSGEKRLGVAEFDESSHAGGCVRCYEVYRSNGGVARRLSERTMRVTLPAPEKRGRIWRLERRGREGRDGGW